MLCSLCYCEEAFISALMLHIVFVGLNAACNICTRNHYAKTLNTNICIVLPENERPGHRFSLNVMIKVNIPLMTGYNVPFIPVNGQ